MNHSINKNGNNSQGVSFSGKGWTSFTTGCNNSSVSTTREKRESSVSINQKPSGIKRPGQSIVDSFEAVLLRNRRSVAPSDKELSYPCPACDQIFTSETVLIYHKEWIHKLPVEKDNTKKSSRDERIDNSLLGKFIPSKFFNSKPRAFCYFCGETKFITLQKYVKLNPIISSTTSFPTQRFKCFSCHSDASIFKSVSDWNVHFYSYHQRSDGISVTACQDCSAYISANYDNKNPKKLIVKIDDKFDYKYVNKCVDFSVYEHPKK